MGGDLRIDRSSIDDERTHIHDSRSDRLPGPRSDIETMAISGDRRVRRLIPTKFIYSLMSALALAMILLASVGLRAQSLPETVEAIDKARVTTRILFITAHPDDEWASLLTYLSRGLNADVALLTITRGQGGQNAIGPEQGAE